MIRVTSRAIESNTESQAVAIHYSVAGHALVSQTALSGLAAFESGPATEQFSELLRAFEEPSLLSDEGIECLYQGHAYFDGDFRPVGYWRSGHLGQINVDRIAVCLIDFDTQHIHILNDGDLGEGLNFEVITGPALVLLLAKQSIFCLHAGGIDCKAGRIAVMAESGAGKSTLSAHGGEAWSQVCDDIMPFGFKHTLANIEKTRSSTDGNVDDSADNSVVKSAEILTVMPEFPQLKLENKTVVDFPKQAAHLDFLIRIKPEPSESIKFSRLARHEAMLQIIRHTVAAKLFDNSQLKKHVSFARDVSSRVPVIEVSYPRELDQLQELREEIVRHLLGLKNPLDKGAK